MRELLKKIILPSPGPVVSAGLIGLMVLGGFLYYKAVRFQRFIEPALAMTQPGSEFDQKVRSLLTEEFGPENANVVRYVLGTIFVHESAFLGNDDHAGRPVVYEKLGRVFRRILEDPKLRPNVKVILVSTFARVSGDPARSSRNRRVRHNMQDVSEEVLNAIYTAEPILETRYGSFFEATAMPVKASESADWVAFRIISSEMLHIEVFRRLNKYVD